MVSTHTNTCDRCTRVNPISFALEPEEAWRTVALNRWRRLCPCFDQLAEQTGVRYRFTELDGMPWSDQPAPRNRPKGGR